MAGNSCGYGDTGSDLRIAGLISGDIASRVAAERLDLAGGIVLKGNRAVNRVPSSRVDVTEIRPA